MIALSPAKINIGLSVKSKREDGFHELESMVIPVPLCDIIEILPNRKDRKSIEFTISGIDPGVPAESNLCIHAADHFYSLTDNTGIEMHLHKQIPVGAGLGGGSSNAATVLSMLNQINGSPLSGNEIHKIAASLGSDCPFFLYNQPVIMTGRGDVLEPVSVDIYGIYFVLLFPGIMINTAMAYQLVNPSIPEYSLRESVQTPINEWKHTVINDFETPLFREHHLLEEIKSELYKHGALYASMSGSGSSMYGFFDKSPELSSALERLVIWRGEMKPFIQIQ